MFRYLAVLGALENCSDLELLEQSAGSRPFRNLAIPLPPGIRTVKLIRYLLVVLP